ncbi:dihydrolipoyl dehydrogenase [Chitinophaga sp. Cy-1792]|uniref:dihydrolipoyl dehydrogenase n=1 Tax=Chitinophaga sp. Cy-1792 TaxID=2608339 RepID=UPI00141F5D44|nr:dihydrolipoyl dehydrogenase [Chitinophaga sp. Cy-1792]NIG54426.1 dihydrolipoyl dehydrogenase [Chitinophaga sp. Cy-1792]
MEQYDLAVIGSGPGGYVAAIRAAQLGYKTALIEKYSTLGGTCTNVGCIPTKALLDSTHHYFDALHNFKAHGIETTTVQLNFTQLNKRKAEVVLKNTQGLDYLMKKNSITRLLGTGSFTDNSTLQVRGNDGAITTVKAAKYIIATGSKPATIPGVAIDKKRIITSTEALSLPEQPKNLVIIGGGVIGVEMASVFSRIGTNVTILEYADQIIPTMDRELGSSLRKILEKEGVKILTQQSVYKADNLGSTAKVWYRNSSNAEQEIEADYVLVAVGRKPYVQGLGLENTGVQLSQRGTVVTNAALETTVPGIYAIGDVIGGAMLAHKAEEEAMYVVESMFGHPHQVKYDCIPGVVYTWPEVASVGLTEEELKRDGIPYRVGKFPFAANARARAGMDTDGFAKVLIDTKYGEILGAHVIGARAADLVTQAIAGKTFEITADEMARAFYPHPTYSEVMKEAWVIGSGRPSVNI